MIRDASLDDAKAIARIYNEGIEDRIATFETELRSVEDIKAWFESGLPFVVLEIESQVLAYALGVRYSGRCAYEGVLEFSFYVARDARGRGFGTAVLSEFIETVRVRGFHKIVGNLMAGNGASAAVMGRCGFREVGVYERHGQLDGEWHDVRVMEILI
ncbi:MAG: arsinothricin resistance N-acetyltransferase ArsN1 family A [Fimbriimonadaceae bacterium]